MKLHRDNTGRILLRGAWNLWRECGFPLEMTHLECQRRGWRIDWHHELKEADKRNEAHAMWRAAREFLPEQERLHVERGFVLLGRSAAGCEPARTVMA